MGYVILIVVALGASFPAKTRCPRAIRRVVVACQCPKEPAPLVITGAESFASSTSLTTTTPVLSSTAAAAALALGYGPRSKFGTVSGVATPAKRSVSKLILCGIVGLILGVVLLVRWMSGYRKPRRYGF